MKTLADLKPARMTNFRACCELCWAFGGLVDVYLVLVEVWYRYMSRDMLMYAFFFVSDCSGVPHRIHLLLALEPLEVGYVAAGRLGRIASEATRDNDRAMMLHPKEAVRPLALIGLQRHALSTGMAGGRHIYSR